MAYSKLLDPYALMEALLMMVSPLFIWGARYFETKKKGWMLVSKVLNQCSGFISAWHFQ